MSTIVRLSRFGIVIALCILGHSVAGAGEPQTIVWDGNGIAPEFIETLRCRHVGIGANLLGNPITRDSTTTAERFFMVQKRALECLPRAVIESRRLIESRAASLSPEATARALDVNHKGDAELFTQLKKHLPALSRRLVTKSTFPSVNRKARRAGDPTKGGYDIDTSAYPWIWSVGPARRRAITPLAIAFEIDSAAGVLDHPDVVARLSPEAHGYLAGPADPPGGRLRTRQQRITANAAFFGAGGPTPEQRHTVDEMLDVGRERVQTVLCHVERTGTEPTETSSCPTGKYDGVRGRTLVEIQAEDAECRVEMAALGVPQLPPHLPPYFVGAPYRDLDELCRNAQRTMLALSAWHDGTSNGSDPLATVNAIAAGYAHGVIIVDRSTDFRLDLEAVPSSQIMKKILLMRHIDLGGLRSDGTCPLDHDPRIINDQIRLDAMAKYARSIKIPRGRRRR
jgi:hypothetical protein